MFQRFTTVRCGVTAAALLLLAAAHAWADNAAPCEASPGPVAVGTAQWNGWGRDLDNSRYQPEPALRAADVARLAVKWAYGYSGDDEAGPPVVVDGRLYFGDAAGHVHALDARLGCSYWVYEAGASVETAVIVGELGASRTLQPAAPSRTSRSRKSKKHHAANIDAHVDVLKAPSAVLFGDSGGVIHALDAQRGTLLWKAQAQAQPGTPLVGSPLVQGYAVYVSSAGPQGGGAMSALDTHSGRLLWSTALEVRSGPAIDAARQLLYVATASGVAALDLADGRLRWQTSLPQAELRQAPILRRLAGDRQVLVVISTVGDVYGLDPARAGETLWQSRVAAEHGAVRIDWSAAADHRNVYIGSEGLGLTAIALDTGKLRWNTPAPRSPSHAITAIPGALFSGSIDGHLRAYSTIAGKVVWDVDTARQYSSVSDSPALGGPPGHGGVIIVKGMVYLEAGTALLAFSVDGK